MKKLLSVILTIIIMAWIIYVPYKISVRLSSFGLLGWVSLPDKTEGIAWYIITGIAYCVVNWFAGLALIAFAAGVLFTVLVVGKLLHYMSLGVYQGILELLEAMEVRK